MDIDLYQIQSLLDPYLKGWGQMKARDRDGGLNYVSVYPAQRAGMGERGAVPNLPETWEQETSLDRHIQQLPLPHQATLTAKYRDRQSERQIAERMDTTRGQVRKHYHETLTALWDERHRWQL